MRSYPIVLVVLSLPALVPAQPAADVDPKTFKDYWKLEDKCTPACYMPAALNLQQKTETGCGEMYYDVRQIQGKIDAVAESAFDYSPVPCADFPKTPKKQPADVVKLAKKALGFPLKTGDVLLVQQPNQPWGDVVDDIGHKIGKHAEVHVYRHNVTVKQSPCGPGADGRLFCEAAGSKGAIAAGGAAFELKTAADQAAAGKKGLCRAAAWEAYAFVAEITEIHEQKLKDHSWVANGSYLLSDGRKVTDKELFEMLDDDKKKAIEQFQKCGGTGEPPIKDGSNHSYAMYKAEGQQALATSNAH